MTHPMTRELAIEEMAEEIGTLSERGENRREVIVGGSKVPQPGPVLEEMEQRRLVQQRDGRIELTPSGESMFRAVIRRHRLAEVLLGQVLRVPEETAGAHACQFEHMLTEDVTDSICTFLGHPPTCPHGKSIPRGDCCAAFRREMRPLVRPVGELTPGAEGRIVFIDRAVQRRLDQLASLGVLPGTTVRLVQRHPSVVLQAGETTVAVDGEISAGIYVRPIAAAD